MRARDLPLLGHFGGEREEFELSVEGKEMGKPHGASEFKEKL